MIGYDYCMHVTEEPGEEVRQSEEPTEELRYSRRGVIRRDIEPVLLPGGVRDEDVEDDTDYLRLFVAIELPRRAVSILDDMARSMSDFSYDGRDRRRPSRGAVAYDAVRWTSAANMHITLKFLGDVHRDDVPYLKEELDEVATDSSRLELELGTNGCFPGERTPRVLWTGMDGDLRRMSSLATRLDGAMVRCGFAEERRVFSPHVTVGRVRSGTQQRILTAIGQRWLEARPSYGRSGGRATVPVESIALMRSYLHYNRPTRYERLHEVGLA